MRREIATGAAFLLGMVSTVWGQQAVDAPRENVNATGKVVAVRPGVLAITSEAGEPWLVKVPDQPQQISFVASAEPGWLQRGMLVRFKNTFDRKGKPLSSVRQLEVISLRADTQLGLVPEGSLSGAAGLFSDEDPTKKQAAPETMTFTVTGTLQGVKDGNLIVLAGGTAVQSTLDKKASISVDVYDYSLAREGDSIQLDGWYYLGKKDHVYANRISISSSKKLGMESDAKKPTASKKSQPKDKKKKEGELSLEDLFSP